MDHKRGVKEPPNPRMQRTALRSRRSSCRLFIYALFVTLLFLAVEALLFFCWFCHDAIK
jgi:hypothetical protein